MPPQTPIDIVPNAPPLRPTHALQIASYLPQLDRYLALMQPRYVMAAGGRRPSRSSDLDQPQTVEQIISDGYFSAPAGDPVTALVGDHELAAKLSLDGVIAQVRERYALWRGHFESIEQAKLAAANTLHEIEAARGPATVEQLASLHATLQRLYQEQRDERLRLWRDVSKLKERLPESVQSYLSAYRNQSIFSDGGGAP